jgi:hypothetical protein
MSDDPKRPVARAAPNRLRIETEEDRERLYATRRNGGMCAACGRALDAGETVYLEWFAVVRRRVYGPVGKECASPGTLARTAETEPERCATCGRGVYYRPSTRHRGRAACSRRCAARATAARHRTKG